MGRRCRHFSWGAIGASAAIDARRITGISNGATLQTWSDASGNGRDFSNSISGERPTYESAGINGLPSVRFASGRGLCRTTTLPVGTLGAETQFALVSFDSPPSAYQAIISNGDTGGTSFTIAVNPSNNLEVYTVTSISVDGGISAGTEIVTISADSSGRSMWRNGATQSLTNSTVAVPTTRAVKTDNSLIFNNINYGAGVGNDKFNSALRGSIGLGLYVPYLMTAPLRKRVEHAIGYSFRRTCS
jgi:hypothetical protein